MRPICPILLLFSACTVPILTPPAPTATHQPLPDLQPD